MRTLSATPPRSIDAPTAPIGAGHFQRRTRGAPVNSGSSHRKVDMDDNDDDDIEDVISWLSSIDGSLRELEKDEEQLE